jgi:hypothetical protein
MLSVGSILGWPRGPRVVSLGAMRTVALVAASFFVTGLLRAESPITKIVLERTACFGTCPVYTLTIHSSGVVEFAGTNHCKASGPQTGKMSPSSFAKLVKKIAEIEFFALRDRYDGKNPDGTGSTVTDLPTRKTTVTRGDETKTVVNYFRGPPGLTELELLIDELANSGKWIRG